MVKFTSICLGTVALFFANCTNANAKDDPWTLVTLLCLKSDCIFHDRTYPSREDCVREMASLHISNQDAFRNRTLCIPGEVVSDWREELGIRKD